MSKKNGKNTNNTTFFFPGQAYVEYLILYNFQTDKACVLSSSYVKDLFTFFFSYDRISKPSLFLKKNGIILISSINLLH